MTLDELLTDLNDGELPSKLATNIATFTPPETCEYNVECMRRAGLEAAAATGFASVKVNNLLR